MTDWTTPRAELDLAEFTERQERAAERSHGDGPVMWARYYAHDVAALLDEVTTLRALLDQARDIAAALEAEVAAVAAIHHSQRWAYAGSLGRYRPARPDEPAAFTGCSCGDDDCSTARALGVEP